MPYDTGCDYMISNVYGTICIQRKDSVAELCQQMEELRHDILPRLISFAENPVLLVEETHTLGESGYLFRKQNKVWIETGTHSGSYYGFLETARMMGVEVVCTRNMDASIWYMAAMDGYLSRYHYPKVQKSYKTNQVATGMLACIPGVGEKRAMKALENNSIADLVGVQQCVGLTKGQLDKVKKVLSWKS